MKCNKCGQEHAEGACPNDDTASAIAARAEAEKPAVVVPPTEYVTREAFEASQMRFIETMERGFERIAAGFTRPAERQAAPEINFDDEIRKAEENGDSGRATELRIAKANKPLMDRMNQIQQQGERSLADIATEVGLSEKDRPFYSRFKKEVDIILNGMPPAYRATPDAMRTALTHVRGQHYDELMKEEREAWGREQTRGTEGGTKPSSTISSREPKGDGPPRPEEVLSEGQMRILEDAGGPDQFARKSSNGKYKTWAEWVNRPAVAQILKLKRSA